MTMLPNKTRPAAAAMPKRSGLMQELTDQIEAARGDPDFMTSLARGMLVLNALSQHGRELTVSQLSEETGLSRAATGRVVHTLTRLGYVGQQGRGHVLLPRVLGIASAHASRSPMIATAQPVLDALRDAVHESCSLGVLDGDDLLYVARAETVRLMSIGLRAGSRLPAYCTSMGRVLLAELAPAARDAYLRRNPPHPRTPRTVTDPDAFVELLRRVRRDGHALVDQELEIGLRSIAVPVRGRDGRLLAALNIGTQAGRVSLQAMQSTLLPALQAAAVRLGPMLG